MKSFQNEQGDRVVEILALPQPSVQSLIRCEDIQKAWREKKPKLMKFFLQPKSVKQIIQLLLQTKQSSTVCKILGLFKSPNQALLQYLTKEIEYSELLLQVLDRPRDSHRYVIGVIMQILLYAFDNYMYEMLDLFDTSYINYTRIISCLHIPSVYHFAVRLVTISEDYKTFVWLVFMALMDMHGTGCAIPESVNRNVIKNAKIPRLNTEQRIKSLQVLCNYFNEFTVEAEIAPKITDALPLLLQDSNDDYERAWVLRLGLNLDPSDGIGRSVLSIVNIFHSSDILIQYSILYIAHFGVNINQKSIELFIYRLLHTNSNNFVFIAASAMIRLIQGVELYSEELAQNIQAIVNNAIIKNPKFKSPTMRAYAIDLIQSSCGSDASVTSQHITDQIRLAKNNELNILDKPELIKELSTKAKLFEEGELKNLKPSYDIKEMWTEPEVIEEKSKLFKTLSRISYATSSPSKKEPLLKPTAPFKGIQNQSAEVLSLFNSDSDDYSDDSSQFRLPLAKSHSVPELKSDSDDDEFVLPLIDVTEKYSDIASPEKDLFSEDVIHEKIPDNEVPRDLSALPKLNPDSPRSKRNTNTSVFSTPSPQRRPIGNIWETAIRELADEYEEEYEYAYEEEEIAEPSPDPLKQVVVVPLPEILDNNSSASSLSPSQEDLLANDPIAMELKARPPLIGEKVTSHTKDNVKVTEGPPSIRAVIDPCTLTVQISPKESKQVIFKPKEPPRNNAMSSGPRNSPSKPVQQKSVSFVETPPRMPGTPPRGYKEPELEELDLSLDMEGETFALPPLKPTRVSAISPPRHKQPKSPSPRPSPSQLLPPPSVPLLLPPPTEISHVRNEISKSSSNCSDSCTSRQESNVKLQLCKVDLTVEFYNVNKTSSTAITPAKNSRNFYSYDDSNDEFEVREDEIQFIEDIIEKAWK